MAQRDLMVIGGSLGGVTTLQQLVGSLPANLPAAVLIVLHIGDRSPSLLPDLLARSGPLPVRFAIDGEALQPGSVLVAPPDRHLLVEDGHVQLWRGPKENFHRPAVNPLFRSAAQSRGEQVIGVILTGGLDDGAAGLWEVKRRGGVTVVQDPEEAYCDSMPRAALQHVAVDHVVTLAQMGPLLAQLTAAPTTSLSSAPKETEMESHLTDLTCPECRGTLWETRHGTLREYRCRVGHAYTTDSMLAGHAEAEERKLWEAAVALEEGAALAYRLAGELDPATRREMERHAAEKQRQASVVRTLLSRLPVNQ